MDLWIPPGLGLRGILSLAQQMAQQTGLVPELLPVVRPERGENLQGIQWPEGCSLFEAASLRQYDILLPRITVFYLPLPAQAARCWPRFYTRLSRVNPRWALLQGSLQ